jgi:hypothetical protein
VPLLVILQAAADGRDLHCQLELFPACPDNSTFPPTATPDSEAMAADPAKKTANDTTRPPVTQLPSDTVEFAHRMFDAARNGDSALLLAAVDAGLPVNLTNAQGSSKF